MIIKKKGTVWYVESKFHDREILSAAHWRWHGTTGCRPNCEACTEEIPFNVWWTPHERHVDLLQSALKKEVRDAKD